jgi:hypothetical protein
MKDGLWLEIVAREDGQGVHVLLGRFARQLFDSRLIGHEDLRTTVAEGVSSWLPNAHVETKRITVFGREDWQSELKLDSLYSQPGPRYS